MPPKPALFAVALGALLAMAVTPIASRSVVIRDYAFKGPIITVTPGTEVVWTNEDDDPHTVTAGDGSFASEGLGQGDLTSARLRQARPLPVSLRGASSRRRNRNERRSRQVSRMDGLVRHGRRVCVDRSSHAQPRARRHRSQRPAGKHADLRRHGTVSIRLACTCARSRTSSMSSRAAPFAAINLSGRARTCESRPKDVPIVVFAHIPLHAVYPDWGWTTSDYLELLTMLRRFESVTVFNGHGHQVLSKVDGSAKFDADSTAFPQPKPGKEAMPHPLVPAGELGRHLGVRLVSVVPGPHAIALADESLAQ